jgi:hypothetical protein
MFCDLATLRTGIPLFASIQQLKWSGPTADFPELAARFNASLKANK